MQLTMETESPRDRAGGAPTSQGSQGDESHHIPSRRGVLPSLCLRRRAPWGGAVSSFWDEGQRQYYQEQCAAPIDITNGFPSAEDLAEGERRGQEQYHDKHVGIQSLERAFNLAEFGYRVFPAVILMEGFEKRRKQPALKNWMRLATGDPHDLCDLWKKAEKAWPGHLIQAGVLIERGFLVVDIDKHRPGAVAWNSVITHQLNFPPGADTAMTCHTPSGGLHVYLRDPSEKAKSKIGLFPGIDILGSGRFAVAYPGLFVMRRGHLAIAPEWCYAPSRANPPRQINHGAWSASFLYGGEIIPEGQRNDTLFFDVAWPMRKN